MIDKRIFELNKSPDSKGQILLKLSRDLRISWNFAINYAANRANKSSEALIIAIILEDYFLHTDRRIDFFKSGLIEFAEKANELNYGIIIFNNYEEFRNYVVNNSYGLIITDFYPLKNAVNNNKLIAEKCNTKFLEIDTHNIVPARYVSNKAEFAAYTIRPKINKLLDDFLVEIPNPEKCNIKPSKEYYFEKNVFLEKLSKLNYESIGVASDYNGGEAAALQKFNYFIEKKLNGYSELRNDPANNHLSDLSPYFNFGFISPQFVAYQVKHLHDNTADSAAFLEEMIIRRELSDNFCLYNGEYDNFNGYHQWAKDTLEEHFADKREYIYDLAALENAATHDKYWNAAQSQMLRTGKMHGYMRMYWAKKIMEWTKTPYEAHEIALYLNDKYELDGYDPNGYVGVAWSIGGVHDRAWQQREIFGKIRYMNAAGLKRKFDIERYANQQLKKNDEILKIFDLI